MQRPAGPARGAKALFSPSCSPHSIYPTLLLRPDSSSPLLCSSPLSDRHRASQLDKISTDCRGEVAPAPLPESRRMAVHTCEGANIGPATMAPARGTGALPMHHMQCNCPWQGLRLPHHAAGKCHPAKIMRAFWGLEGAFRRAAGLDAPFNTYFTCPAGWQPCEALFGLLWMCARWHQVTGRSAQLPPACAYALPDTQVGKRWRAPMPPFLGAMMAPQHTAHGTGQLNASGRATTCFPKTHVPGQAAKAADTRI